MTDDRIPLMSSLLQLWDAERPRSKQTRPGPSDLGGCRKKLGYKLAGQRPDNSSSSVQAALGTAFHEKVAEILRSMNRPGWLIEHPVELAGIPGTLDLYAHKTVVDWKTTSAHGLRTLEVHGPYLAHLWQIHFYGAALAKQGYEVERVRLNYLVRDSGKEAIYEAPLDLKYVRDILERYREVSTTALEWLPRDYAPDSVFCQGCDFLNACWGGADPGRDPRSVMYADDKAALADELYRIREQLGELGDRADTIKGIMDAVRPDEPGAIVQCGDKAVTWDARGALRFVKSQRSPLLTVPKSLGRIVETTEATPHPEEKAHDDHDG